MTIPAATAANAYAALARMGEQTKVSLVTSPGKRVGRISARCSKTRSTA